MKFDWKKALKISLCVFGLFLAITYWQPFIVLLGVILSAMNPLIIGGIIAFIVNIPMTFLEGKIFGKLRVAKGKKGKWTDKSRDWYGEAVYSICIEKK